MLPLSPSKRRSLAVGIADQRVGNSSQINQAVPFGIIAREPQGFETKHQIHARERHFGGKAGKARTPRARTGEAEILVDNDDAFIGIAEITRFDDNHLRPVRRFELCSTCAARLAQIDEGMSRKMTWRNLDVLIHRLPPSTGCSEARMR
jgi:hypothetical protein